MLSRFVACVAAMSSLLSGVAVAQVWSEYRPEGGRYKIEMPGTPTVATISMPVGGGKAVPMTEASVKGGPVVYIASFVDYPTSVTKGASSERLLNLVRDGSSAGQTYRNEKKITLGRAEGREYTVVQSDGTNVATRIYWVRGRLYQLVAAGGPGVETLPDTRHFLESFALVGQ